MNSDERDGAGESAKQAPYEHDAGRVVIGHIHVACASAEWLSQAHPGGQAPCLPSQDHALLHRPLSRVEVKLSASDVRQALSAWVERQEWARGSCVRLDVRAVDVVVSVEAGIRVEWWDRGEGKRGE